MSWKSPQVVGIGLLFDVVAALLFILAELRVSRKGRWDGTSAWIGAIGLMHAVFSLAWCMSRH